MKTKNQNAATAKASGSPEVKDLEPQGTEAVKGGRTMTLKSAIAKEKERVDDDQSQVQFLIQGASK